MAPTAGHSIGIFAVAQDFATADPAAIATYTEICGLDSLEFNEERVSLDKTDFKCSLDARTRFLGLKDGSFSLSGFWDSADLGQVELNTAFTGNSTSCVWIAIAFTGNMADGNEHVKCVITSRNRSVSVDGRVEVSYSLEFNGAVAAGPVT